MIAGRADLPVRPAPVVLARPGVLPVPPPPVPAQCGTVPADLREEMAPRPLPTPAVVQAGAGAETTGPVDVQPASATVP